MTLKDLFYFRCQTHDNAGFVVQFVFLSFIKRKNIRAKSREISKLTKCRQTYGEKSKYLLSNIFFQPAEVFSYLRMLTNEN